MKPRNPTGPIPAETNNRMRAVAAAPPSPQMVQAGIGGLDLGLDRAGWTCVGQVELDPFCRRVLAKHWPEVPRHDDVRSCVEWWRSEPRPAVDAVVGGFPCQPISYAGKGLAQEDERWLWPDMVLVIRDLRPRWVVLENVPALLGRGMGDVLGDLAAGGYDAQWDCLPAAAFGAPHRRDRVFVVAYPNGERGRDEPVPVAECPYPAHTFADGQAQPVAHAEGVRRGEGWAWRSADDGPAWSAKSAPRLDWSSTDTTREGRDTRRAAASGEAAPSVEVEDGSEPARGTWWTTEPDVGRSLDGFSSWLDRSGRLKQPHELVSAYAHAENSDPAETVRTMRRAHGPGDSEWTVGGRGSLSPQAVLLAYLRQLEANCRQARAPLASTETSGASLRGVRLDEITARPSLRRQPSQQRPREPSDPLYALSQLLARSAEQAWAAYRRSVAGSVGWHWEDGLVRVAYGVPHRMDRLRALGNAVVPQVAEHIGRMILASA